MARLALTIAGGIIGGLLALPTGGVSVGLGISLGEMVGGIAGALIFPGKGTHIYGPRVNDLQVSSSAPGSVIPMLWGSMRYGGQIIAGNGISEVTTTTKQSAKGGPSVTNTTYTYFCSFAAAFCKGPATITRIWGDSKLIYDNSGPNTNKGTWDSSVNYLTGDVVQAGSTYYVAKQDNTNHNPAARDIFGYLEAQLFWSPTTKPKTSVSQIAKNVNVRPTLYKGTTTQTADPTLVSMNGANLTPGYRGICYAVWNKFPLADFGNRLPNIRAEVTSTDTAATPEVRMGVDFSGTNSTNYPPFVTKTSPDGLVGFTCNLNGPVVGLPYFARLDLSNNTVVAQGLADTTPIEPISDLSGFTTIDPGYTGFGGTFCVDSNYDVWASCVDHNGQPAIVCFDGWTLKAKKYINATQVRTALYNPDGFDSMVVYHTDSTDYILLSAYYSTYSGFFANGYVVAVFRLSDCSLVGQYPYAQPDVLDPTDTFTVPQVTQYLPVVDQKGNFFYTWQGFHDDVHSNHYTTYDAYIAKVYMPGGVSNFVAAASPAYTDVKRWRIDGNATNGMITNIMYDGDDDTLIAFTTTGVIYKIDASDGTVLQTTAPNQFNYSNGSFAIDYMVRAQKGVCANGVFFAGRYGTGNGEKLVCFNASDLTVFNYYDPRSFPHLPATSQNLSQGTLTFDPVGNSILLNTYGWYVPDSPYGSGGTFSNRYAVYRLYLDRVSTAGYGCDQIVKDICNMAGIVDANIDGSQIASLSVQGYPVAQIQAGKDMINVLAQIKFFEGRERDFKMEFIPRGQDAIETIASDDLGMESDKGHLTESLAQEQDRPKIVEVMFTNPDLDYQQDKQNRVRHSKTMKSKNVTSISTPIVMTAFEAAGTADKILWTAEAEARTFKTSTHKAYNLLFDPCDVINLVTDDGLTLTARITQAQMGQNFASAWELTSEDSNNYISSQSAVTDTGFVGQTLSGLSPTLWWLLDLPLLTDSDASGDGNTGYYFAGDPFATGGSWRGFALYNSSDNATFNQQGASVEAMSYGIATNALAAPASPWRWDEVNTLTVKMLNGTAPSSTSDLNVLNGANAAILVPSGEVIQWGTATLNSDGSYTLSHLLRGRRGTELSCGTAAAGEKVLFPLTAGGLHRSVAGTSLIGQTRYWKAVTLGSDVNSPLPLTTYALKGTDLKPYFPVDITGSLSGGTWTIGWRRRTRLGGDWQNGDGSGSPTYTGMAVPLNEDGQAYFVEITDSTGVVKRSSTVTSNRFTYAAADQTTDFGGAQTTIYVNVYQISATVGLGFKGSAVITESKTLPDVDTAPAMTDIPTLGSGTTVTTGGSGDTVTVGVE